MNQNILIPALTLIFYVTSILGGGGGTIPEQTLPTEITESAVIGQQGKIMGNNVTVRSGPGTNYDAITSLSENDQVILLDLADNWYQVKLDDGKTGWIADYLISIQPNLVIEKPHSKGVLGYYLVGTSSYDSLIQNSNSLTGIAPWSWGLNSYGNLVPDFDSQALAKVLQFSGNRQIKTYALIHNLFNGTFDSRVVSALLNNQVARSRAINEIKTTLLNWGMSGINLDLESVYPQDRETLNTFVAELSEALHQESLTVTMAVPAKTWDDPNNNHSAAYDYAKLGEHVDQLVIMAYDQHYRGGDPGPVAAYPWVESVIQYAVSQVPASKIVLGIPNYGYDWPSSGMADALTYDQTMQLAASEGASIRWESDSKVPYFTYGNNRQVWFENRYSIKYKLELVNEYNLNGIALWRLGQEDQGIWDVINETLN